MCIVFYDLSHPGYKLIFASNRDEYLDRPARAAQWHNFQDASSSSASGSVLSGVDLGGTDLGTWCGMTRDLKVGVITNIRDARAASPSVPSKSKPSRGRLLRQFLTSNDENPITAFLAAHRDEAMQYDGFNLLLFDLKDNTNVGYLCNHPELVDWCVSSREQNGPQGLSNTPMNQPWPKVVNGKQKMAQILSEWHDEDAGVEALMKLLRQSIPMQSLADAQNCTCIPPVRLPPPASAPAASSEGRWYGTRVSTVILVSHSGDVTFVERDVSSLEDGVVSSGSEERRVKFRVT